MLAILRFECYWACDAKVSMLLSLLLANIRIKFCLLLANTRIKFCLFICSVSTALINHDLQSEFQLIISKILDYHKCRWPRNFRFKFFLSIYLLKKLTIRNITVCAEITVYWSATILIISLKENVAFVKLFQKSFGSNTFVAFQNLKKTDNTRVNSFMIRLLNQWLHTSASDQRVIQFILGSNAFASFIKSLKKFLGIPKFF